MRLTVLLLILCGLVAAAFHRSGTAVMASGAAKDGTRPLDNPDLVCARCHAAIYASYRRTAMGAGSGEALAGLLPGDFLHVASGVQYEVFRRDGRAWMSFSRAPADPTGPALDGTRQLLYFIGSGKQGRTYLYQAAGEWFELPINYYTPQRHWEMAPAFKDATSMPAPLPVEPNCLHCHASEVEEPLPEARNRFPDRPFDQGGIGCSACHGDPRAHLASGGRDPILNPSRMTPAARDSVCIQCHLEGEEVVYRPGRSLAAFRPGDRLSDFALYFVRASQTGGGQRATSQYEALLKSACKRGAGDRLTCTSCHDPHSQPSAAGRVAFYRAKCLACHTSPELATEHHPEQPDCAVCHMPSRNTTDISHEQVTDHDIERNHTENMEKSPPSIEGEQLVTVGAVAAGDRELGLAYAQRAQKGDRKAAERALQLLRKAELAGAEDEQVHVNLGFLEQISGLTPEARQEYAAALRENPYNATALTNRAVLDARAGELGESLRLLDRLLRADPSQTLAGVDLLKLECQTGEPERATLLLQSLLAVNPDAPELRPFAGPNVCATSGAQGR